MKKHVELYKILVLSLLVLIMVPGFLMNTKKDTEIIPTDLEWSERMALSIMSRNPEPWQLEFSEAPKWSYTHGLVLLSFYRLYEETGKDKYLKYILDYADTMVDDEGEILTYDIEDFNIDHLNPGHVLIIAYEKTKDEKYKKALDNLWKQLNWQPRTTEGGFWHKLRYPWQMWLDGLYMGSPFYAHYTAKFDGKKSNYDDIVNQFIIMEKHARDAKTGLLYHGWDESKVQEWANDNNGTSKNFWGRAMGWYAMGIVDVLDYLPKDHEGRQKLIDILDRLVVALEPYQDETGLWYQVVDMGNKEGNYLEASASSMIVYAIAKGVNEGYLDNSKMKIAKKGYEGIIDNLIKVDESGGVHITNVCSVAGLGGNPYRDGTFEYYVSEPRRDNDPKATGPFILASIELNK